MKRILIFAVVAGTAFSQTKPVSLSPVFVTATRAADAIELVPFSHVAIAGDDLRESANVTVDGTLRAIPGFSLFRRTDSLVANPTAQGVSLRGVGPSGASRSLVLLDGIPLNDPFGGWVLWSKVPRESLASLELVPGAGGTAWGNAALGGVIQLFTEPPVGSRERLAARFGSFNTNDFEGELTQPMGSGTLQLLGRYLSTDGYFVVSPERRGPIDTPASSRSRSLTGRWRQRIGDSLAATITVRRFSESRGNGTPYQQNGSDETFASVVLDGQVSDSFNWKASVYAQGQDFSSTFSSVNATRTAESPASDQFAVPSTAVGFAWAGDWRGAADSRTSAGFDVRDVRGETREDSAFVGNAFTRRRFAGGRQTMAGVFIMHSRTLAKNLRVSFGARADDWQDSDGHRRDLLNGAPAGDEHFPSANGVAVSPSAGVVWSGEGGLRLHASAQHAFRRPTLNELYRPFRVGNVITDANPALRTETITSGEVGARFVRGSLDVDVTGFVNDLHDAVGNVTIAHGPGTFPGIGFVPAGGEGRRRLNLDRARVQGATVSARWELASNLKLSLQYLYDDATVRRATVSPNLEGLRLAQVPRHSASAALDWKHRRLTVSPQIRFIGEQFEDDANTLRLAPATLIDLAIHVRIDPHAEIFITAENIADHRLETGRSSDGLVNIGSPRLILFGIRSSW